MVTIMRKKIQELCERIESLESNLNKSNMQKKNKLIQKLKDTEEEK